VRPKDLTQEETQDVGGAGKNGVEEEGSESLGWVGTWLIQILEVEGVNEVGGVTKFVGQEP
jgi:hypothetical protein